MRKKATTIYPSEWKEHIDRNTFSPVCRVPKSPSPLVVSFSVFEVVARPSIDVHGLLTDIRMVAKAFQRMQGLLYSVKSLIYAKKW